MRSPDTDFEFERRFLVESLPHELVAGSKPDVIVQTYFLAAQGYGLRIRLQVTAPDIELPLDVSGKAAIGLFLDRFDLCMLAVKGPSVGGTRYEAEREIDINVGAQMCLLGGKTLAKRRYGLWLGQDGWVIDQFAGDDEPLIVAECERTSPVIDLEIPSFCIEEITNDSRFNNDSLVNHPYSRWAEEYREQSEQARLYGRNEPRFNSDFGTNRPLTGHG